MAASAPRTYVSALSRASCLHGCVASYLRALDQAAAIFIFSHFDAVPVDSSSHDGWIVRRLRAMAFASCVERLSQARTQRLHQP